MLILVASISVDSVCRNQSLQLAGSNKLLLTCITVTAIGRSPLPKNAPAKKSFSISDEPLKHVLFKFCVITSTKLE